MNQKNNPRRNVIKESQLRKMISECLQKVLRESFNDDDTHISNYRDVMSDENGSLWEEIRDFLSEHGITNLDITDYDTLYNAAECLKKNGWLNQETANEMVRVVELEYKSYQQNVDALKNDIQQMLEEVGQQNEARKYAKKSLKEDRGSLKQCIPYAVEKFNELYHNNKESVDNHIQKVIQSNEYRDLETRLSWDIARAANYIKWNCFERDNCGYIAYPDSQLTTLFKQALRQSDIKI